VPAPAAPAERRAATERMSFRRRKSGTARMFRQGCRLLPRPSDKFFQAHRTREQGAGIMSGHRFSWGGIGTWVSSGILPEKSVVRRLVQAVRQRLADRSACAGSTGRRLRPVSGSAMFQWAQTAPGSPRRVSEPAAAWLSAAPADHGESCAILRRTTGAADRIYQAADCSPENRCRHPAAPATCQPGRRGCCPGRRRPPPTNPRLPTGTERP
jgi:hypothetical protein